MKKTLLTLMSCMVAWFANAQEPVITLTAEVVEAERTFEFGSAAEGENKISIDWGDGTIVEGATITGVYDGWETTPVTGTPKGNGEIKIYATGGICYFDCISKVDGPGITKLDVSKATELAELYANGNKLTSFDASMLEKLSKLELHNNSLTEVSLPSSLTTLKLDNNKLTSFDGSSCTSVTTLYLSNNELGTLDVSNMPALKSLYALNCGLTSFNAGALETKKAYISLNNNLLETLDVSEATGLENGSLFAMGNNLTEIKLPSVKVKAVNISKNKFTLATIPATANVTTLTYAPQQDMVIEDINETIDLSAQNNLTGFAGEAQPTIYTWCTEAGDTLVVGVDYTEEAGKFTFIKEQAQKVYCTMSTAALPKFTGTNVFKTTAVAVTVKAGEEPAQEPVITLTAEVVEAERTFEFGSAAEGENKISIDWGDGTIVEGATITGVYDGWTTTPVTGTPKGNGEIKIYATGGICYFDCISKVDGPGITKLDVSKATELAELYANGNKLTSFDASMLEKLSKLELHNNSLTEVSLPSSLTTLKLDNNKLTSFDGSSCTSVTTLYLSNNELGTLDVSNMPALKSLYALNCGLTSFNAGALETKKAYISLNNNLLETLDVSEATGLENGSLFAMGNNLTEIKLPSVKVKAVNISKNKFTLATIPATANVTTLTYAPQQDMVIEDINETIDLSAQNNLTGFAGEAQPTIYTWCTEAGDTLVVGVDYTEEAGKFTFIKEQAQKVYCTMSTAALPKFTGTNVFKTTAVAVTVKAGEEPAQEPVITLTAEVVEAERTFEFGSAAEGENKISIDWGDGTIVEGATITGVYDGWTTTPVTGTPKGNGEIKIYATGAICYFDCVSKVDGPGITKLDVSKATELTELYANGNKLTSFDASMLEKLSKVYLNNNLLTGASLPSSVTYLNISNNKLASFDGSNLTALTTLYLSDNSSLGTLDVSNMSALKSLYAINCGLTSFNAGALTTAKAYISVNNNLLETLDVSEATGLENGSLFAMGNNLTEIKLPSVKVKAVNISKNKFTLATIPATANVTTLTYAPQQDMVIEDINETIDLSAQNNLTGFAAEAQPTIYTWCTEAGDTLVVGVDYTEEAGKFTFIKEQAQKVYCTMSTAALPKFTGTNVFKTVAVAVTAVASGIENVEAAELAGDIYSVDGKLIKSGAAVSEMPKGLYIVKTAAGKAVKVVRK